MVFSIHEASVPVFVRQLGGLNKVLGKAARFAETRNIEPAALLSLRLAPDMFPLVQQVQLATDLAKGGAARLAGVEFAEDPHTESTIPELQTRIAETIAFVRDFTPEQLAGAEDRAIIAMVGRNQGFRYESNGAGYLLGYAMPNFLFHVTTAYVLLRHAGVEIGKRDFLNSL